jgi:CHAT domain-containing protein
VIGACNVFSPIATGCYHQVDPGCFKGAADSFSASVETLGDAIKMVWRFDSLHPFQYLAQIIGYFGMILATATARFFGMGTTRSDRNSSVIALPLTADTSECAMFSFKRLTVSLTGFWLLLAVQAQTQAQPAYVAPPRNISDITAILDQQKPDPTKAEKTRAEANTNPPNVNDRSALGRFYFQRAVARATLGRTKEAIADGEKAADYGSDFFTEVSRYLEFVSNQYFAAGNSKRGIEINEQLSRKTEELGRGKGRQFAANLRIVMAYLSLGELDKAEIYVTKSHALLNEAKAWKNVDIYRTFYEAYTMNVDARLMDARGRYRDAESAYRKSQMLLRDAVVKSASWPVPRLPGGFESQIDFLTALEGLTKWRQGRLVEAEADVRRALLSRLSTVGKYHPDTAQISGYLANLLSEQSRFPEAEQLARTAVEIYRTLGYPETVPAHAFALNRLAMTLFTQRRWDEAGKVYDKLNVETKDWEASRAASIGLNWSRIFTYYNTGKLEQGIELARRLIERNSKRVGDKHYETAIATATLGTGLVYAQRDAEALAEFKRAMPILLASSRDEADDTTTATAIELRTQTLIEAYLILLSRNRRVVADAPTESFRLGESIRGRSVEKALSASSARLIARDSALAEWVRKEQDLEKQIGAELGALNNMLALPPETRNDKDVAVLRGTIEKFRAQRMGFRRNIEKQFPSYAELVTPRPATVEDVRAALKPDEAFLSFYLGRRASFVWVVPRSGQVAFAYIAMGAADVDKKVQRLREALEPNATMISDIPSFDVALAHELYTLLLKPVEAGWKPAKNLIVTTNGALGLLPLGLLTTAPSLVKTDEQPLFAGYRTVPWLARTHAVTLVPSAAALRTLRQLPPGSDKRDRVIGFGDPLFSKEQASNALLATEATDVTTRGLPLRRRAAPQTNGVDGASLAMLPRLPDTADELKSIAVTLQADPSKVLNLGKAANEQIVKGSDLSKYRIIVFATHGLVPGDLDGLHQPALALSAPEVAGVPGDGLLTMEEILALKLDADWVVLSACNTGAASGAGAEAASGLGRAFFYAGTRAILVTNWSVHSQSARELVTDLFRRQADDAKLSRGEALQLAMMALMDGKGFTDDKRETVFSYAHPLFWAPYTIIGDGG